MYHLLWTIHFFGSGSQSANLESNLPASSLLAFQRQSNQGKARDGLVRMLSACEEYFSLIWSDSAQQAHAMEEETPVAKVIFVPKEKPA